MGVHFSLTTRRVLKQLACIAAKADLGAYTATCGHYTYAHTIGVIHAVCTKGFAL